MAVEQQWSLSGCKSSSMYKSAGTKSGLASADFERELVIYGSRSLPAEPKNHRWCLLTILIILTTVSAIASSVSLYLDNFAGVSELGRTIDLPYPRLENELMSTVVFNDSIPNTAGIFHKYIDLHSSMDSKTVTVRKGVLSQCDKPLATPAAVRYVESPWSPRTCAPDSVNTFFCPVVAIRFGPGMPEVIAGSSASNGCFTREQRCDGILNCPSGHDEMGCAQTPSCPPGASQCPGKNVCVKDSQLCDGLNNCGMYEDESNCCGVDGFIRCNDGHCVSGSRCDGQAECLDLSDEYNCPMPSDSTYFQCNDGQLIEGRHVCNAGSATLQPYQCRDLSDETECSGHRFTDGHASATFDRDSRCFVFHFSSDVAAAASDGLPNGSGSGSGRGSHRRSGFSAASSGHYEWVIAAALAASVTSTTCGWVACLLAWLSACSSCLRRRPLAASRVLLLSSGLLFVCAAAECAVVACWCLYATDVNRELLAKQPSVLGQVFRETLLALGVEFRFKTSFVLTAVVAAAHLACVVLSLVVRHSRMHERDGFRSSGGSSGSIGRASFGIEGDGSRRRQPERFSKKSGKEKMVPLLGTADCSSLSEGGETGLCLKGGMQLDYERAACDEEEGGGEQQSLPEKVDSLDSLHWADVDKEKLQAALDDAAATVIDDELDATALLPPSLLPPPPAACVGSQGVDPLKDASGDDAVVGAGGRGGFEIAMPSRLSKSRTLTLPCVQESEHEGAEDACVNVARRAGDNAYHSDSSSSSSPKLARREGDGACRASSPPTFCCGDYGSQPRGIEVEVEGEGLRPSCSSCDEAQGSASDLVAKAAAATGSSSSSPCGIDEAGECGSGRCGKGPLIAAAGGTNWLEVHCCEEAERPAASASGRHGEAAAVHDPLLVNRESGAAAGIVATTSDGGWFDGDDNVDELSIEGTDELYKQRDEEHVPAFAVPSGHQARAGR